MIHLLLGIVAAAALGADASAKPASAISPAPAPPPRTAMTPDEFGKPYRLAPARINADGKVVFRFDVESTNSISCVALKREPDGKVTEEPRVAFAFKPSVVLQEKTMYLADIRWFTLDGKAVDAEAARSRLAAWNPVLMSAPDRSIYSEGSSDIALAACFRPDTLVAAIADKPPTTVAREKSPGCEKSPASPIPILASMDAKGRVVFRRTFRCIPVFETRVKTVTHQTAKGPCSKQICYTVCHMIRESCPDEVAVEAKYVQFFDTEGEPIEAAAAATRLAKETSVLLSNDGEKINRFFLKAAQPGTMTCVVPFRILESFVPATAPKACVPQKPSPPASPSPAPVANTLGSSPSSR